MTTSLITLPYLQQAGVVFDARTLVQWLPNDVDCEPSLLAFKINALLDSTARTCWLQNKERGWRPKKEQLGLALAALVYSGVDLGPASQEACLLSYWDKRENAHNIVPYVMQNGLRRLASDRYPIDHETTRIVVQGDHWRHEETDEKTVIEWKAGQDRNRVQLVQLSKALGVVVALWTRISMLGRPAFNGVLEGFHLREVLQSNSAARAGRPTTPWGTNFVAMLRKTSVIHTYRQLPLTGRPAAAMNVVSLADSGDMGKMRQHLLDAGRAEQVSDEALEILGEEPIGGADDGDALEPFQFQAQDEPTSSGLDAYIEYSGSLRAQLYEHLAKHQFDECRVVCSELRVLWAEHMSTPFRDDEILRIEGDVQ